MTYSRSIPYAIEGAITEISKYISGIVQHTYPDNMDNYVSNDGTIVALYDYGHIAVDAYKVRTFAFTSDPQYWPPMYGAVFGAPATLNYDRAYAAFYEQLYSSESNPNHLAALSAYEHTLSNLVNPLSLHTHVFKDGSYRTIDPGESYPGTVVDSPPGLNSLGVWVFDTEEQYNNWVATAGGVGLTGSTIPIIGYHLFGNVPLNVYWLTQERVLIGSLYYWTGRYIVGKVTQGIAPPSTQKSVEEGLVRTLGPVVYVNEVTEENITLIDADSSDDQYSMVYPDLLADTRRRRRQAIFGL